MKRKKCEGFTLIEILAVLSIIVVIMSLTVGLVSVVNVKTTESRAYKDIAKIEEALEAYHKVNGFYPPDQPTAGYILPQDLYRYMELRYDDFTDGDGATLRLYLDPWGIQYRYIKKDGNDFDVLVGSFGRDRQPGVENVNDDGDSDSSNNDIDEMGYGDDITNRSR